MKRILLAGLVLAALAALWFLALQLTTPSVPVSAVSTPRAPIASASSSTRSSDSNGPPGGGSPAPAAAVPLQRLDLAKDLNAPGKTIQDDLHVIDGVFSVWQSNFLKEGNPTGENVEITAALAGKNSLHVAFIAPDHPAINAQGELCDRWHTPFFFHQQSGSKMEIRSAGPDRIRGTADDVVFTP